MGREVRRVPANWQHPKDDNGNFIPLLDGDMPRWPESECTHLMMYESVTEGTPISPAFETPEELAHWLTDNGADAYAGRTATYQGWLRVAKGGYAPSMVVVDGVMTSGVDGLK